LWQKLYPAVESAAGAKDGWLRFLGGLEPVVARME
jgi:hypothetical protein